MKLLHEPSSPSVLFQLHPFHSLRLWFPKAIPYVELRRRNKLIVVIYGFKWHACHMEKWTLDISGYSWRQWSGETVSGNRTLCGTIVCSFSLEGEMASSVLQFILLSTLWSKGWLHGHEHPWDILIKLERISVERSLDSHLRNRKEC